MGSERGTSKGEPVKRGSLKGTSKEKISKGKTSYIGDNVRERVVKGN